MTGAPDRRDHIRHWPYNTDRGEHRIIAQLVQSTHS